jgi:predicted 3-demethylubiquinone-9 3-methyltransferase (glyoxalase superfamily)
MPLNSRMPAARKRVMRDPDRQRARRVTEAMLGMAKLDVAALDAAARGRAP